jgi:CheY-like chemotaxis protein
MENPAKEHGVTLQIDRMEGEHWNLIGSPAPLRRILNNLINNATKYNRKNGTISISCREIDISSQEGQTVYEITCADTGIGMSRDFQTHMFEQFMQENATEGLAHHGTGLGLSIVKNLVERMSGSIRCESERGKGTTFYIKIPFEINTDVVETPVIAEDVPEEALQGVSVLLVEDNELNMEIAEFILGEMGMKITKAWNGQEAVQIFEQSKLGEIQIILMDMMMPVMNGEQAARAIRELDRADARTVPIIATTANAFEEDVKAALGAGMNDHLAKPLDEKALKKVMAHYVTTNVKYGT